MAKAPKKVEISVTEEEVATLFKIEPKKPDPFLPEGKTIDERMADLLEEHKKMGAR